jgi:hypothetical protein
VSDAQRNDNAVGLSPCMEYDVPEAALRKWAEKCLTCLHDQNGECRYRFQFQGSTCMNGGHPFTAHLQILLRREERGLVIRDALIFFAQEDMGVVTRLCAYEERGQAFLDELQTAPSFCGQTLEEALSQPLPTNPAGCLCTQPMVNHKWRLALSTLHYSLCHQG